MGTFIPAGMTDDILDPHALVINTCTGNDTDLAGDEHNWVWANPTNRKFGHEYHGREAVSVAALWQGTKVYGPINEPDEFALAGDWRRGKGRAPRGAWAGPGEDLISDIGAARRAIFLPAYKYQIMSWVVGDDKVGEMVHKARHHEGPVYLRDFDTDQGLDNPTAMSHAWLLSVWLNVGEWPK